jgi:hypothetical protein
MKTAALLLLLAAIFDPASHAHAQRLQTDRAMMGSLTNEIIGLARSTQRQDTTVQSILVTGANFQRELGDVDGFLATSQLIRRMPHSLAEYRKLSKDFVCELLGDRRIDDAKRYALAMADTKSEEDDWLRASLVIRLLKLPAAVSDDAKLVTIDSAALRKDAFEIAGAIRTPEVSTDLNLVFTNWFMEKADSSAARNALKVADSARRLISDSVRAKSRAAMEVHKAANLGDWRLADALVDELWHWKHFDVIARLPSNSNSGRSSRIEAFNKRIFDHYLELLKQNPDNRVRTHAYESLRTQLEYTNRKALADSLMLPPRVERKATDEAEPQPEPHPLMVRAMESIRKGNVQETERLFRAVPDPDHNGMPARTMISMSSNAYPDDAPKLLKRGLTMLLADRTLRNRDQILHELARERMTIWGDSESAITLVNEIKDPRIARETVSGIGESSFEQFDAMKLRRLAQRARAKAVKDQVLFRLMTTSLLKQNATPRAHEWGLALADSITTPEVRAAAKIEIGKFYWFRGDTARARELLLASLSKPIKNQEPFERYTVISLVIAANGTNDLVAMARARRDPIERIRGLTEIVYHLRARLFREKMLRSLDRSCPADF